VHVVAVRGEGAHLLAPRRRPPPHQRAAGVRAGVAGQVGEEAVHAQQVRQVRPVGQMPAATPGPVPAGQVLTPLGRDDFHAELSEYVVVRVGTAVGTLRPEPVENA
jgi:hypothetical protein